MATTTSPTPVQTAAVINPKEQFLATFELEHATTMRILRAFPADKAELQPHAKCKSARDLAFIFVMEMGLLEKALTTGFDWSQPPNYPATPESIETIIEAFDQSHKRVANIVAGLRDDQLFETVRFFVAPKTLGDVPKLQFMWMVLCDQIHHRGQFSVYLRMADGKVPSIYGPTADEPWM
jgi:uncharacterized damage-inducible protein DinB